VNFTHFFIDLFTVIIYAEIMENLRKWLEDHKVEVGERLKEIRAEASQSDFALRINADRSMVSRWENGITALSPQNLAYICNIFDIDQNWLLTGKGNKVLTDEIAKNPEEKELLAIFRRLSVEMREFFLNTGRDLLAKSEKKRVMMPDEREKGEMAG
jgi:transcriptional regulator with XRE-family HTH domain